MNSRISGVFWTLLLAISILIAGCGGGGTSAIGPTVISVTPTNGSVAVPTDSLITATFNTPMNPNSVNSSSIVVTAPAAAGPFKGKKGLAQLKGAPQTGTITLPTVVTFSGSKATVNVTGLMPQNTLITVTITTDITNLANQHLEAPYVWSFTTGTNDVPPTVSSTIPASNATGVVVSSNVSATFNKAMDPATLTTATFYIKDPSGTAVPAVVSYANNTATLNPTAPLVGSTVYTGVITTHAKDVAGTFLVSNYTWTFTTGVVDVAPTVVSVVPLAGATGVSISTKVTANFSEAMTASTINTTTVTLKAPGGVLVPATVTYANNSAVLSPTAPLLGSTLYTAQVTTGVTDVAGTPMASNYTWTFTTLSTDIAPTVISTIPITSAVGVLANAKVTVTFSEAMSAATINGTTISIADPSNTVVPASVTYSNSVATLTPTSPLVGGTKYTATVTTGVQDVAGTAMVNAYKWTFTTDVPPVVLSTVPLNNANPVGLKTAVAATFNEDLDPTTVNGTTFTLTPAGGANVPATVTYSNRVATLTPNASLVGGTVYTATLSTGIKDMPGTSMAATYTWTFTTDVPPTVVSTFPVNNQVQVGVSNSVTVTFSKAMDPATITGLTFTLKGPGGVTVPSTVGYANNVATLSPTSPLAGTTLYTANVTTGAQDLLGTPLATNHSWSFTTGQADVAFGTAGTYGVLAGSTVTSTGPTVIKGDIGVSPGTAITGFPPGTLTGVIHAGDSVAAQAKLDLLAAYTDAAGRLGANALAGDVSGLTFTPGLYKNSSSVILGVGANVTFDAQGDANAVFIIQMGSTLTTGVGSTMTLVGGAQPSHIYWSVGSSATLGVNSSAVGNILASASITANTGMTLQGRFLTNIAAVTLDSGTVTVPPKSRRQGPPPPPRRVGGK